MKLKIYTLILFSSILLCSCMVGPNFHTPAPPHTRKYTHSPMPAKTVSTRVHGGQAQRFVQGRDIPAEWWKLFHSKPLDDLICLGLANNATLEAAQAALIQARENWHAEIGNNLFPAVNSSFTAERLRFNPASIGGQNIPPQTFDLYTAQLSASYNLDVFGGLRRQIESYRALVDYQTYEREANILTITSNIVTAAVTDASLRGQIQATIELIRILEDQLKIIRGQFELGGASKADILTQETLIEQTKATLPPLQKTLELNRDSLSILVGELPSQSQLPQFNLADFELPTELPISIPCYLVRQRPDVRASEALLHQASAQIGVATANLLPTFPLTANYGYQSTMLSKLFEHRNMIWSIVGEVTQPIFHGGALLAQRRAALAAYDQAFANYRQTVLSAFQNVADALHSIEIDARELKAQASAERAALATLNLTRGQYKLGAVSYLILLNAERAYLQARISRIQAQAARYSDTSALFQSLGGGWWNRGDIQ